MFTTLFYLKKNKKQNNKKIKIFKNKKGQLKF